MLQYVLQKTTSSFCNDCEKNVYLLIEKYPNPGVNAIFYICFDCEKVSQAGVGPLEPIDPEDP